MGLEGRCRLTCPYGSSGGKMIHSSRVGERRLMQGTHAVKRCSAVMLLPLRVFTRVKPHLR